MEEYGNAGLGARWKEHRAAATMKSKGQIAHDKTLQKPGTLSKTCLLAVFPYGTPPVYYFLNETMSMIFPGSYEEP